MRAVQFRLVLFFLRVGFFVVRLYIVSGMMLTMRLKPGIAWSATDLFLRRTLAITHPQEEETKKCSPKK